MQYSLICRNLAKYYNWMSTMWWNMTSIPKVSIGIEIAIHNAHSTVRKVFEDASLHDVSIYPGFGIDA